MGGEFTYPKMVPLVLTTTAIYLLLGLALGLNAFDTDFPKVTTTWCAHPRELLHNLGVQKQASGTRNIYAAMSSGGQQVGFL